MPLHTTDHKPNPTAIYRSSEVLLHQRISSTSDQTIIMTTYLEELKVGTDLANARQTGNVHISLRMGTCSRRKVGTLVPSTVAYTIAP